MVYIMVRSKFPQLKLPYIGGKYTPFITILSMSEYPKATHLDSDRRFSQVSRVACIEARHACPQLLQGRRARCRVCRPRLLATAQDAAFSATFLVAEKAK